MKVSTAENFPIYGIMELQFDMFYAVEAGSDHAHYNGAMLSNDAMKKSRARDKQ